MKKTDPFKIRKSKKRTTATPRPSAKKSKDDLARAVLLIRRIQEIKDMYKELDHITEKLLKQGFTEGFFEGLHIVMNDKFSTKNTVWKSTPQRRYELEIA